MIVIAENINVMSRSLGPAMRNRDSAPLIEMAKKLEANGADYLDINVGPAKKDGPEFFQWIIKEIQGAVTIPLCLDTTNMDAMEAGLEVYNPQYGKPIINSVSVIESTMNRMLPIAKEKNAALVALMYSQDGIPRDTDERGMLAADIGYRASEAGIANEDLFFDPVVVPVSSQQNQVVSCTEFTGMIQDFAPGANSTCGLSNVSNGAPDELREKINQPYLLMLKRQGMTSAIMDGLDMEIIDLAKGKMQRLEEIVAKTMDGEEIPEAELKDQKEKDFVKTVKLLENRTLYSDSWLDI